MNKLLIALVLMPMMALAGEVTITCVAAKQRYPWNGRVDIVVTLEGSSNDVDVTECTFAATNSATHKKLHVENVHHNGVISGSGTVWKRNYVWEAGADIGEVRVDDIALTVGLKTLAVQLWENGPYWAVCNVGAKEPEEYGYYFTWGDTVGYTRRGGTWKEVGTQYYYSGLTWVSDAGVSMKSSPFSYNACQTYAKNSVQLQSAGYIDSEGNLKAAHDAATAHLGALWRMPSSKEFSRLCGNCDTRWETVNGVAGRLVTGRGAYASKSIFLPAAGYGYETAHYYPTWTCNYWSSTVQKEDDTMSAWEFGGSSSPIGLGQNSFMRHYGLSVRPVRGVAK